MTPGLDGRRVLLVRLGALGDVINTTVLVRNLKRRWPGCHITWAVHPTAAPLITGNPEIDEVFAVPRAAVPWGLPSVGRELSARGFDVAIDLQKLFKSGLLTFLSGAPRRLGYDRGRAKELSWLFTNERLLPRDPRRHVVDQVLEFATLLGVEDPRPEWSLPVRESDRALARELMDDPGPWAILCLGGSEAIKRWDPVGFAAVADSFQVDHGFRVLLLAGPDPVEAELTARTMAASRHPPVCAQGRGDFRQIMGLLERASLFVGGDTGPLHLSAAMKVPTIGLYGAQDPRRSGPYGWLDYVVFKGVPCSPCMKSTCRIRTVECMTRIRPEDVLDRVSALEGKGLIPQVRP